MITGTIPFHVNRTCSALRRAAVALALWCVAVASSATAQLIPNEMPAEIRGMELQDHLGEKIPLNLDFLDSTGKRVRLSEKFGHGRPVVVAMVYFSCPLLCPQLQQKVIQSFNEQEFTIGSDFDVLFVSFDSREGSLEAKKARDSALLMYKRTATETVQQGFTYLTGPAANTQQLADALGFPYRFLPESAQYSHGTAVYVVTPEGVISRCFTKLEYGPKDLRLALVEASDGKIGSFLDRYTLWCYHPTATGAYMFSPLRVMRVGAAGCAAIFLAFVGVWAMRDYRRRRRSGAPGKDGAGGIDSLTINSSSALGQPR